MNTPIPSTGSVKPLFSLPQTVHKIGFVEQLTRAVADPKNTAETYVVTPALVNEFGKALEIVGGALHDGRSRAAYLHGSFGSGKSHFMAMISLLLDGDEHAWRLPELHPLREKYPFCGNAKVLKLHFHLVGHEGNLESAIFGRYLDMLRDKHPDADMPGVFADEQLFDDARRVLDELGDDKFFAPMNPKSEGDGGSSDAHAWGAIADAERWTRERFDAAARSTDPDQRAALFNALARTRFRAFAEESRQYVELDEGLATLARHAKKLGYDALLLFLDELILWFASRASDVGWFHNEVQKLVKLVEAQESRREIPVVSFIARQRDLAEMVGNDYAGIENALVRDSLKWSKERFDAINLEDRNLPAIAEKRVLRPKDAEASKAIDAAFRTMRNNLGAAGWQLLMGALDEKEFRRLYPFSPALMDALVALSNSLQRERTSIRLLTEIMVEHIEDLTVGDIVGVGDLFDVVAGGNDATDGIMRARFESAKQLYSFQFLPVIQQANGTSTPERCQRLRPNHPARIGCSNCRESACRTDNRLIKTLLIAALVPEVKAFKELTASKLAQLNHGSLRLPIAGTEVTVVAQKLRNWASSGTIAQLHVGTQSDPTVRVQLEGVDPGPILEQARQFDTPGARQKVIRDLLFDALQIERIQDWGKDHAIEWRGTKRTGHIRFGNVRRMTDEQLMCAEDDDWRLVVDYPFDEPQFTPRDDEKVLEKFVQSHPVGTWTLVWLPTFFSNDMCKMLGELVILEHILQDGPTTRQYVSHLSVENQTRAITDLENLRNQKRSRLVDVLGQAYGVAKARETDLDLSNAVERHQVLLKPGATFRSQLAATLGDAVDRFASELLDARFPLHPKFPKKLTKNAAEELVVRFAEIVDAPDKSIPVDRERAAAMRDFLGELGLVRVTEDKAFLRDDDILQRLENTRVRKADERPDVGEVRSWIDDTRKRGLQPDVLDLIVRCYARWSTRTLVSGEAPYEPKPGHRIPDYVLLERPDLPTPTAWSAALARASDVVGETLSGRALHGDNLKRFEAVVLKKVKEQQPAATRLPALLERWFAQFGVERASDRLVTAWSGEAIANELNGIKGKHLVEALAAFEPKTSGRAVGRSLGGAIDAVRALEDDLVLAPFTHLQSRADLAGAAELIDELTQALRQDEMHVALGPRARELAKKATALLTPVAAPAGAEVRRLVVDGRGRARASQALAKAFDDARAALDAAGDDVVLSGSIVVSWEKKR